MNLFLIVKIVVVVAALVAWLVLGRAFDGRKLW
jgi:hypothetical protein